MTDHFNPSIRALLTKATSFKSPTEFWECQTLIRDRLLILESLVRKRRAQKDCLKLEKFEYSKSPGRTISKIHRFDDVIDHVERSESRLRDSVAATRFVGDLLVSSVLPLHEIKTLTYNRESGFIYGQEGSQHEFEIADRLASLGYRVFMNDLSHCVRIGDLLVWGPDGIQIVECKMSRIEEGLSKETRIYRQLSRMDHISEVLANQSRSLRELWQEQNPEFDMILPAGFFEIQQEHHYLVQELVTACDLGDNEFKILRAEPGLYYVAVSEDVHVETWGQELKERLESDQIAIGSLQERIQGQHAYVAPMALQGIPIELLHRFLLGDLLFYTVVDIRYVIAQLHNCNIPTIEDENLLSIPQIRESRSEMWFEIRSTWLMHVLYGFRSLTATIDQLESIYFGISSAIDALEESYQDQDE